MLARLDLGARIFDAWKAFKRTTDGDRVLAIQHDLAEMRYPNLGTFRAQAKAYEENSWVYIAVDAIATAGALVQFNVFRLENEKKTGIVNHPFEQLMRRPNVWQTPFELLYNTLAFRELTGNAYWWLNIQGSQLVEIIGLRPDRIRIVPGSTTEQPVAGYVYEVDHMEVPLEAAEVVHFPLFKPSDDFYGMSRLEAAALTVQTDNAMQRWNRDYFGKDKAVPTGLVSIQTLVSDTEFKRIKAEWYQNYGGTTRRTAIVRGADVKWQDIGTSHHEMDFLQGREANKDEIFQIFGIPPGLYDKASTEANANAAMEMFTGNKVWPTMIAMSQKMTLRIMPMYGPDLIVEPDDIRRKDTAAERAEMQAYSVIMTINELRQRYLKLPPVPWGDIPPAGAGAAAITGQPIGFDKLPKDVRQTPSDTTIRQQEQRAEGTTPQLKAVNTPPVNPCYVILSLTNEPSIAAILESLRKQRPDIQWEDPADLHVTLVYALDAQDTQSVREVLPHSIKPIAFQVGPLTSFDNADSVPIVLKVQKTPALVALQSGLVAMFGALGLQLSSYSSPDAWTPHVTLGYATPGTTIPTYNAVVTVSSKSLIASVDDGDNGFSTMYQTKALDVPRVLRTRAMKREIDQFVRYASKGKNPDHFQFLEAPKGIVIAVKALADVKQTDLLKTAKIMPAEQRVSLSGHVDPHAREKVKVAQAFAVAFAAALLKLQADYLAGIRHIQQTGATYGSYFNAAWWRAEQAAFVASLYAAGFDALQSASEDTAGVLAMRTGIDYDPAALSGEVASQAKQWSEQVVPGVFDTTRTALDATYDRWNTMEDADESDLVSSVKESAVFGDDRADLIGETEATRIFLFGAIIAAVLISDEANIDFDPSQYTDLVPAHVNCRCWLENELVYDDNDRPMGMDMRYHTAQDDRVCAICEPRDGLLASEIVERNL